tara:strand:+ start:2894 stop:3208 length:315 start_codon:yes stop_codon:yes gene_type:complete
MRYLFKTFLTLLLLMIMTACTNLKENLSLKKQKNIEEFLIKKKSPLTLPPDFSSLPEPKNSNQDVISENEEIDLKKVLTETKKNETINTSNNLEKSISNILKKR